MDSGREPNWNQWRAATFVTVWEAVCLSLNIEPQRVLYLESWDGQGVPRFVESGEWIERVTAAIRNVGRPWSVQVVKSTYPIEAEVNLRQFAFWAGSVDWEVPAEFAAMAQSNESVPNRVAGGTTEVRGSLSAPQDTRSSKTNALSSKERNSLLKLVIGMAIAAYRYDPGANRSPVTAEITKDLENLGLVLDEDTVRKYLQEASGLLPSDQPTSRVIKPKPSR